MASLRFAAIFVLLGGCEPSSGELVVKQPLPATEKECVAKGGDWVAPTPTAIVSGCHLLTTDGGKKCSSSKDCQSECVETSNGNECAAAIDGCFTPTGRDTVTQCAF